MTSRLIVSTALLLVMVSASGAAQTSGGNAPVVVSRGADVIRKVEGGKPFDLPADAAAAVRSYRTRTVPYWHFFFSSDGSTYGPEFAVGKSIFSNGGTEYVSVPIIPVRFRFPAYSDPETGQPVVLDATPDVSKVLLSPTFSASPYSSGFTQFQDAVQRASFYGYYADSWHTMLTPRATDTVIIDVPADKGRVYRIAGTGTPFALLDAAWFAQQQTRTNADLHISVEQLPVFLTHNIGVYFNGDPATGCCSLSWHGAYLSQIQAGTYFIQTHVWASWFTPDVIEPEFADVYALTHEIGEWMNDPFAGNIVPHWDYPQGPDFGYVPGYCAAGFNETYLLEVADPLQNYAFSYHLPMNGFVYHVANQALASWFTRDVPSTGIHGAYSFPDETLLSGPSPQCR